ncbi:ferredoxin-type protein NapF [Dyella koreensis]|uniref:Ferredoxin-type protein NapF n=1 Tax=Dyella koreensis TaxID=311235 RepID=A0ABW8K2Z4_9GAMM
MASPDNVPHAGRRAFLRGRASARTTIRPPWALLEPRFLDACTRCGECVETCPEQVLVIGTGGYPEFDPRLGECSFCGSCVDTCASKALDRSTTSLPWHWKAHIQHDRCFAEQGIVCASCADGCPERAIRLRPALGGIQTITVDPAACTGCGACVSLCPATAIALRIPEAPP